MIPRFEKTELLDEPKHPLLASVPEKHEALKSHHSSIQPLPPSQLGPASASLTSALVPVAGTRAPTGGGGYVTRYDEAEPRSAWAGGSVVSAR